jgi:hypothetical protein
LTWAGLAIADEGGGTTMPEYLLHHTHEADDCPKLYEEWVKYDTPLKGKGLSFFCTCPSGEHGGFTRVDANNEREALALMPELHRRTTRVYSGETMPLDV